MAKKTGRVAKVGLETAALLGWFALAARAVSGAEVSAVAAGPPGLRARANAIALAMLRNIRENGFDSDPRVNGGLGGLWINWRTGSNPLRVNFNGSGKPDHREPPRHDPLTDFRYLHNLLSWKHRHPADPQFDGEIKKFTAIVKREFAQTHDERGWLYDELMDMARTSGDDFFRQTARGLAANYARQLDRSGVGVIYKTNARNPRGYYRVDLALEAGCTLVMAGTQFRQPDWTAKGEGLVNFVYDHAYLRKYHLFLTQMDKVRLPGGAVNPDETIYREPFRGYLVNGGIVRFGNFGLEALSLLHTFIVTTNKLWLDRAGDLLAPLTAKENRLGLWDAKNGGYFNGVEFDGPDFQNPGRPKRLDDKKESGRQFHVLQAFHVADELTGGRYQATEEALLRVLVDKAYYAPGRGIVYEMTPDWSLRRLKNGAAEDWVTSEAMGCAMRAIFSLDEKQPW